MIITNQVVVRQAAQEKHLSFDAFHFIRKLAVVLTATRNGEVAHVDGVVPFPPRPPRDVRGNFCVKVIERHVPHL